MSAFAAGALSAPVIAALCIYVLPSFLTTALAGALGGLLLLSTFAAHVVFRRRGGWMAGPNTAGVAGTLCVFSVTGMIGGAAEHDSLMMLFGAAGGLVGAALMTSGLHVSRAPGRLLRAGIGALPAIGYLGLFMLAISMPQIEPGRWLAPSLVCMGLSALFGLAGFVRLWLDLKFSNRELARAS